MQGWLSIVLMIALGLLFAVPSVVLSKLLGPKKPTPEKLAMLREFLGEFGLQLGGGDTPHAGDYAKLLERIKGRADAQMLQTVLLRSLQQAVYSPDNVGHFGLAYESYTHFTSPIRRYPDLLVHRAIKAVLAKQRYAPGDWAELGGHCSMTERRADEATRDVVSWLKCFYMRDRIGEHFEGTITGVTGFGAAVPLMSDPLCRWPMMASVIANTMNRTAKPVVIFDSSVALPRAPKAAWLLPPPNALAMSPPLPCCSRMTASRTRQTST